jgi:hypothetical protein
LGDSALAVDIIVVLIKTLDLTELVSDALTSRKQKEAETNFKIVDLFKETLDEIKHCRTEQQREEFHKYEEYKGVRFGNGDCDLVVDV